MPRCSCSVAVGEDFAPTDLAPRRMRPAGGEDGDLQAHCFVKRPSTLGRENHRALSIGQATRLAPVAGRLSLVAPCGEALLTSDGGPGGREQSA